MNYVSAYDTIFIPINNCFNSFCYHLTVMQQLHMSITLNHLLKDYHSESNYINQMLEPLMIYALITEDNRRDVYIRMKSSYQHLINAVISEHGKRGYSPFIVLYFYILPIIYQCFPDSFKQICVEASIDPIFLKSPDLTVESQIKTTPLIKDQFIDEQTQMTLNMNAANIDFERGPFRGGILEVYPNSHSYDGGHALFILNANRTYYVFDDDTTISLFRDYVNGRDKHINRICIRGIDNDVANDLQSLWNKQILTKRVNNRFELINNGSDETITHVVQPFISIHDQHESMEMSGGDDAEHGHRSYVWLFITFIMIQFIVIVILAIALIRVHHDRHVNEV